MDPNSFLNSPSPAAITVNGTALSSQECYWIVSGARKGMSLSELASAYYITEADVEAVLRWDAGGDDVGEEGEGGGRGAPPRPALVDPRGGPAVIRARAERDAEIARLVPTMYPAEAARHFNMGVSTLQHIARKHGVWFKKYVRDASSMQAARDARARKIAEGMLTPAGQKPAAPPLTTPAGRVFNSFEERDAEIARLAPTHNLDQLCSVFDLSNSQIRNILSRLQVSAKRKERDGNTVAQSLRKARLVREHKQLNGAKPLKVPKATKAEMEAAAAAPATSSPSDPLALIAKAGELLTVLRGFDPKGRPQIIRSLDTLLAILAPMEAAERTAVLDFVVKVLDG